jgi:hypothetical protein
MKLRAFLASILLASAASAQTPEDLAQARRLFTEALRDQEAGRYELALEKFERVQKVKDTAPIRYRIASCDESLGHLRKAAREYEGAIALGQGNAADADVVKGSRERLEVLGRKAARLTIALKGQTSEAKVAVDEESLERSELERGVWLDPGKHVVTATAREATSSRTEIALPAGGRASLTISLDPVQPDQTNAPPSSGTLVVQPPDKDRDRDHPPAAADDTRLERTAGWIAIGAGGVLVIGSAVTLIVRHGQISDINNTCPGGHCPPSTESNITSMRKKALWEGPLGVTLGVVGLVSAGVGTVLVLRADGVLGRGGYVAPAATAGGGGIVLGGLM